MAGVHVDAMTGWKGLILTSCFSMEDPGYAVEVHSFKPLLKS